jgi:hypothetical protein
MINVQSRVAVCATFFASPGNALARGQHKPNGIAVDEATVFWLNEGNTGEPGALHPQRLLD